MVRGQKLPIFSGNGLPHDRVSAQVVRQARLLEEQVEFSIVFAAMGVKHDVAEFFIRNFRDSGALARTVMFFSLADAPSVERLLTPRVALTLAEHLAFDCGQHVLVLLTDMTNYCESLREVGTARGEIPGRKGYPGYLYSDLASIYERAGRIEGSPGSITQMAILTMPADDISHPVPDLTGYITEGQIVLDRDLFQRGVYPPIAGFPSLSRLMKDGVGKGYTREDHPALASQLFACYAYVKRVRGLADVIGEEELSPLDKLYLKFGEAFEMRFLNQGEYENRSIETTLELGWDVLSTLPQDELHRVSDALIKQHYREKTETSASTPPLRVNGYDGDMGKLNVAPTKSNLLALKRQLAFAEEGYDLLEQKRQILVSELMRRLARVRDAQSEAAEVLRRAFDALSEAQLDSGSEALDRASLGVRMDHEVKLSASI